MSLKSIIYDIVHHACQSRAHCPTMISSFKLFLGTVCLSRFCRRAVIYIKKSKTCGFQLIEAALRITQVDDQMLEIYRVIGQMTLKSTTCGIVYHARRN